MALPQGTAGRRPPRQGTEPCVSCGINSLEMSLTGGGETFGHSASAQSKFTPCFSSFCLALLGKLKALSWGLGTPELRSGAPSCWK